MRQIPGAVRWEALTALLLEQGVTTFFELGPGKVLAGLVKRQAKEAGLEVQACLHRRPRGPPGGPGQS